MEDNSTLVFTVALGADGLYGLYTVIYGAFAFFISASKDDADCLLLNPMFKVFLLINVFFGLTSILRILVIAVMVLTYFASIWYEQKQFDNV
jgi:ABC-type phosphate transport system permease subunit